MNLLLLIISFYSLADAHLRNGHLSIAITRHHQGDIFTVRGGKCYKDFCVSLSSGTAAPTGNGDCECKCGASRPVFRDDLSTCVDDIQECSLVPFGSSAVTKKIPYVFLPLKGQIVYPSADIAVPGEEGPVCVVSGGQFLGQSGWVKLRNSSGTESPFRLFRDEGRTYLQWFGETGLRMAMEGRIILVHLMCKDASAVEEPKIFTPCIGFRVAGKPSVKEMMFATDVHLKEEYGGGLSVREYVAIGVCSLLLAVAYVAAVVLYLYIRKRKRKTGNKISGKTAALTLGEEGIIKSNPLLRAARHLPSDGHDNAGYVSESNSCCSDTDRTSDLLCLDDEDLTGPQNMQTAAIIHPCDLDYGEAITAQDPNNMEKLPEENVSIVETLETREHPETVKGMGCGNGRRKLYFNPSYFEPDLLKAPPPAAIEFLMKIREVIAIAKHKMSAKKFSPSLLGIPEEDSASRTDHNSSLGGRKGSAADETLAAKESPHFPAPPPPDFHPPSPELSWPSDAKQKIIRKWLEDVPVMVVGTEACKQQKERNASTPWQTSPWQTKEGAEKESLSAPPGRQERRKQKARAPPAPPQKKEPLRVASSEGGRFDASMPPRPPPMPVFTSSSDQFPPIQAKDSVPPALAKNLMDAVIQELSSLKKDAKKSKGKDSEEKVKEMWQGKRESREGDRAPTAEGIGTKDELSQRKSTTADAPPDDHEYEVILLNSDQATSEGKDMKIYNLPELLSKNEQQLEGYSLVSEVYVNDGYSCCSEESASSSWCNMSVGSDNVHYDVPSEKPGRLTIHVSDSPDRYKAPAAESDNFEPDTLDRKPRKSRPLTRNTNDTERYSNQKFHDMESHLSSNDSEKFTDSLERPRILLKTNGTFNRTPLDNNVHDLLRNFSWNNVEPFGSLREIYQAKARNHKRRKETSSLIDSAHTDHDRVSTLSWGEDKRNKLLHRGIVLHITDEDTRRHKRSARKQPKLVLPPKVPSRPPKPSPTPSPTPRSRSVSPTVTSKCDSPTNRFPPSRTTASPPLPPPRSVPPSPPPRSTSSPSPQPTPRSSTSSPVPSLSLSPSPSPHPHLHSTLFNNLPIPPLPPSPHSLPPPPRPPKSIPSNVTPGPLLPPRTAKPPLPPKHPKRHPKPSNFAARPLPPLPRPTNHCVSSPTQSPHTPPGEPRLCSPDYEPFYSLPHPDDRLPTTTATDPTKKPNPTYHHNKPRPEDPGYLSNDSDSFCPQLFTFSTPTPDAPDAPAPNTDTDESLCDGASESGAESIATDSFFYGNFNNASPNPSDDREPHELRTCALRLSDVEITSDADRHCVPIMVRP